MALKVETLGVARAANISDNRDSPRSQCSRLPQEMMEALKLMASGGTVSERITERSSRAVDHRKPFSHALMVALAVMVLSGTLAFGSPCNSWHAVLHIPTFSLALMLALQLTMSGCNAAVGISASSCSPGIHCLPCPHALISALKKIVSGRIARAAISRNNCSAAGHSPCRPHALIPELKLTTSTCALPTGSDPQYPKPTSTEKTPDPVAWKIGRRCLDYIIRNSSNQRMRTK